MNVQNKWKVVQAEDDKFTEWHPTKDITIKEAHFQGFIDCIEWLRTLPWNEALEIVAEHEPKPKDNGKREKHYPRGC